MTVELPKDKQIIKAAKEKKADFRKFVDKKIAPGNPAKARKKADIKDLFNEDIKAIANKTQQELAGLKNDIAAKTRLYEGMNAKFQVINDAYKGSIHRAGGANKRIDTNIEHIELSMYYMPALRSLDLQNIYDNIGKEWEKTDEGRTFEMVKRLATGGELESADYNDLAKQLVGKAGSGVKTIKIQENKPEKILIDAGRAGLLAVAGGLKGPQRMELADALIAKGEAGIEVIHRFGLGAYYSSTQLEQIYKNARLKGVSESFLAKYLEKIENGVYAKAAKQVREYLEGAKKGIDKFPHVNFARHTLTYLNVILYEFLGRGALVVLGLTAYKHLIKDKDPIALLTSPTGLGAAVVAGGAYDVVTSGHLRGMASEIGGKKKRKQEKQERLRGEFMDDYFGKPDMAKWFRRNFETIRGKYLEKTKDKKAKTKITFAEMGLDPPEERDDIKKDADLETLISKWVYELNWELSGKETGKNALDKMWKEHTGNA